ncbi:hypothetical protein [Nonomuraea bangladeshensis]|uniref:hypothetical protein n=1 Tax=Nonomuraea bangladeshensis TaxID=404385 RepID=UPI0031D1D78F
MGYKRARKVYNLQFADPEMDGLEVRARSMPLGDLMTMADTIDNLDKATLADVDGMLATFAEVLVSWNLEDDDDRPIPATVEGLKGQDQEFVFAIVGAYVNAVSGVSDPLPQPSPGGEPSLAASIPMETSSASLAS